MTSIEFRFSGSDRESQTVHIPKSTGKKRIHLVFTSASKDVRSKAADHIETLIIGQNIWYKCKECDSRFLVFSSARKHVHSVHLKQSTLLCFICGKSFKTQSVYKSHMEIHEKKPFKCSMCNRRFDAEEKLKIHFDYQHGYRESRYQCPTCNKKFSGMGHLKKHLLIHDKDLREFKCHICLRAFYDRQSLKKHIASHEKFGIFKCTVCGNQFNLKRSLNRHMKIKHGNEKPSTDSNLEVESAVSGKDETSTSDQAQLDKDNSTDELQQKSITSMTSEPNQTHQSTCQVNESAEQPNATSELSQLTADQQGQDTNNQGIPSILNVKTENDALPQAHTPEQENIEEAQVGNEHLGDIIPIEITIQDTELSNELVEVPISKSNDTELTNINELIDNMAGGNAQDKPPKEERLYRPRITEFICDYCGKVLKKKDALQYHVQNEHLGGVEKKYQCLICQKSFKQKPHLARHMKIHSDEKSEICDICGKGFNRRDKLVEHISKMHDPEKEAVVGSCQICFKSFKNLKVHMRQAHCATSSYECKECGQKYSSKENLDKHIVQGQHLDNKRVGKTCHICFATFSKADKMRRHLVNIHGKDGKVSTWQCHSCFRQFVDEKSFHRHVCKGHIEPKKTYQRKTPRKKMTVAIRGKTKRRAESSSESDSYEESEAEEEVIEEEVIEESQDGFDVLEFI